MSSLCVLTRGLRYNERALGYFADGRWIMQFADNRREEVFWGDSGDLPVPADYNGDGRTDYAMFRPATGAWWILFSGGSGTRGASVYGHPNLSDPQGAHSTGAA